jgi:Protein of unknown function (DUF3306)
MSNPENFLTRWSRRKHAAAAETEDAKSPAAPSSVASEEAIGSEGAAEAEHSNDDSPALPGGPSDAIEPPFDPASVPPIESITADTDIRAFLVPGVPPELTRAALRRAWTADPKIRDFVGLADYDWDFNAPGSMAGFGALEMTDELGRLAAQIIGAAPTQDQTAGIPNPASVEIISGQNSGKPDRIAQAGSVGHEDDHIGLAQNAPVKKPVESTHHDQENGAARCQPRNPENSQLIVHRSHGRALPK